MQVSRCTSKSRKDEKGDGWVERDDQRCDVRRGSVCSEGFVLKVVLVGAAATTEGQFAG